MLNIEPDNNEDLDNELKGITPEVDETIQDPEPIVLPELDETVQEPEPTVLPELDETVQEPERSVEDVILDAITPKVEDSSQAITVAPVEPVRTGPETIFEPTGLEEKIVASGIKPVIPVDYKSKSDSIVSLLNEKKVLDDITNSQGKVSGLRDKVREEIKKDSVLAESKGIEFSSSKAYTLTMSNLYIDTMGRLGKNVEGLDINNLRFTKYVTSQEGIREIEQGLTILNTYSRFNGNLPDIVNRRLEFPAGKGILDSKFIGLTNKDYEGMGVLGKIGYNLAVAGSNFSQTVFGVSDVGGEIVPDVAPAGEIVGTMAGWVIPYGAVTKVFKAKGILQGTGKLGKFGSALVRDAIAGAIADTYVFESDEGTLGDVFADVDNDIINNGLTTVLAIDIEDSEFEAKAKIALEGVVLGVAMDGVILGLKKLKTGTVTKVASKFKKAGLAGEREALSPVLRKKLKKLEEDKALALEQLERNEDMAARRLEAVDADIVEYNITDSFEIVKLTEEARAKGQAPVRMAKAALANIDRKISDISSDVEPTPEEVKAALDFINETVAPIEETIAKESEALKEAQRFSSLKKNIPSKVDLGNRLRRLAEKEGDSGIMERFRKLGTIFDLIKDVEQGGDVNQLDKFKADIPEIIHDILQVSRVNDVNDIELALETAAVLYRQDNSRANKTRLLLLFDMVEESTFKGRKRELVPATFDKNKKSLDSLFEGELSDADMDNIDVVRNKSNKLSIEGVLKFAEDLSAVGVRKPPKAGRTVKGAASIAVDIRTNNILYSLGLPALATVGGVLVKSAREAELGIGRLVQKLFTKSDKPLVRTYREVNTLDTEIDNILYTLSGGKVESAGRDLEVGDFGRLFSGLLSASAPSRVDPSIGLKSEVLASAGLKAGYNAKLGVDPSGLSKLGKWAQGLEVESLGDTGNEALRLLVTSLVSLVEFIPRKGLGTIDEALKTRDIIREFQVRIDNNIKEISIGSSIAELTTEDQATIAEIIKEAFVANLGARRTDGVESIDFVESIMETLTQRARANIGEGSTVNAGFEANIVTLSKVSNPSPEVKETLDKAVLFTEDKRVLLENLEEIKRVVSKSLDEAQQFAREGTVTQDVPAMMEKFIKGIQGNTLGRAFAPFARSITNIAGMTIARTPVSALILKKERLALWGKLGEIEQARSLGKLALGSGLMVMGAVLSDKEEGIRLETTDHGSWREHSLVIPKSASEFEDNIRNSSLRWYHNNIEIINRELERIDPEVDKGVYVLDDSGKVALTEQNAINFIMSNLPDWEDREGSVKIDFSRLGPFNTLVEIGMMLHDAGDKTLWDYMEPEDEINWQGLEPITQTLDFIGKQGYLGAADDFLQMFSNPDYAADAYIKGWGADLTNFGKGIFSTAGEPLQKDFRPSRSNSIWSQKKFNQILLAQDPNSLMKRRDFLGRVIDPPNRVAFTVGIKQNLDIITSEMEDLRITKRVPKPKSVGSWKGIDLRKFRLHTNLTDTERSTINAAVPATDGINAYEDWLIMSGSTNVSNGSGEGVTGSSTSLLQKYFKTAKYKEMKSLVMGIDSSSSPEDIEEAEIGLKIIKSDINARIQIGSKKATSNLWELADLYVNVDGITLREVFNTNQRSVVQATENVLKAGQAAEEMEREVQAIKAETARNTGLEKLTEGGIK